MTDLSLKNRRAVATWIYIGVAMLLVQVILGGITRLTGSGLSITEWNVLSSKGFLPPLNQQQWLTEFQKYQHTEQYRILNTDFTLGRFKSIYFWEWFHREWARLIGVVFIVGFIYLLATKKLERWIIKPLLILFLLGALQGAVGWIMVLSGLTGDMVYVKPLKLALHFVFALVLICYTWWFALQLSVSSHERIVNTRIRGYTWTILAVLFFQLIYGALMAGHKAASAAPTWPDINGDLIPAHLFSPAVNMVENKITVHFIHRSLAYLLFLLTAALCWQYRYQPVASATFKKGRWVPAMLILLQLLLGIAAVNTSPGIIPNRWVMFDWIAELHQVVALLFMLSMVWILFMVRSKQVQQLL